MGYNFDQLKYLHKRFNDNDIFRTGTNDNDMNRLEHDIAMYPLSARAYMRDYTAFNQSNIKK